METPESMSPQLPQSFAIGAATAAWQVEGAWDLDGKGESNWDRRSRVPGAIEGGATGDQAVDHYHRWREDVDWMRWLGLDAYRFSIAWSRVQPLGRGRPNEAGLAFYDRLVDALLDSGIEPFATLCHYDSPQALHEAHGGWRSREMAHRFADYAAIVARRLGDRVRHLATLNEPLCVEDFHHGPIAPAERVAAIHHLLLGHGMGLAAVKAERPEACVGLVNCLWPIEADTPARASRATQGGVMVREEQVGLSTRPPTPENLADAARIADGQVNRLMLDALFRGAYPEDAVRDLQAPLPVREGDLKVIAARMDFFGLNYYSRIVVRPALLEGRPWFACVPAAELEGPASTMGWEIHPPGLRTSLERLWKDYRVPAIWITETGVALPETPGPSGEVDDGARIDFLAGHLGVALACARDGAPLRGAFIWSLLDNVEWSLGWSQRFGLLHVDRATLDRRPKRSARWLRDLLARRGSHRLRP